MEYTYELSKNIKYVFEDQLRKFINDDTKMRSTKRKENTTDANAYKNNHKWHDKLQPLLKNGIYR